MTPHLTPRQIVETVAQLHDLTVEDLKGPSRRHHIILARHEAWLALRQHTFMSLKEIGRTFDRDHTTVLEGVRRAADRKGIPVPPPKKPPRRPRRRCKVDGCRRVHRGRGFCEGHLERVRRHGDPMAHIRLGGRRRLLKPEPPPPATCEGCGGTPLGGGRWCTVGGCTKELAQRAWSWSRSAA